MSMFKSCWLFLGCHHKQGYGEVFYKGKIHLAHRMSYLNFRGSIPEGLNVLHKCDNTSCINPSHLYLGTYSDNLKDVYKRTGRTQKGTANGNAKLRPTDVSLIRKLWKTNAFRLKDLERMFHISDSNIRFIVDGITWCKN